MFRFTTLATLVTVFLACAVMTGCDTGSNGSKALSPTAPPKAGSEQSAPEPPKVPKPG